MIQILKTKNLLAYHGSIFSLDPVTCGQRTFHPFTRAFGERPVFREGCVDGDFSPRSLYIFLLPSGQLSSLITHRQNRIVSSLATPRPRTGPTGISVVLGSRTRPGTLCLQHFRYSISFCRWGSEWLVSSGHMANEEGKEVSTESALFLRFSSSPSPIEDQTLMTSEQRGIYCGVIFFSFIHISYLLTQFFFST